MICNENRDPGLLAAIAAVGGISSLARLLNLRQPSVSGWRRVPPHRIVQVEEATGLDRVVLRPDLYVRARPPYDQPDEADAGLRAK